MVDKEVVDVLAEIKHRVLSSRAEEPSAQPSTNGASATPQVTPHDFPSLAVLARSWDRLPPLVTNRTGGAAKIDLWIKTKMKTAFRWFTWEQVNFNAATHQTFKELIESLAVQQQLLATIQKQLEDSHQKLADELDQLHRQLDSVREQNEQLRSTVNIHEANFGVQRALQAEVKANLQNLSNQVDETKTSFARENESRVKDVLRELREKHEQILDEHRVSFKQLSLQLTEAQVLQDRARRELDVRVAKLES